MIVITITMVTNLIIFINIIIPNIFLNITILNNITIILILLTARLLSLYGAAIKFHAPDVSPHLIANIITTMRMMMMIVIRWAVILKKLTLFGIFP